MDDSEYVQNMKTAEMAIRQAALFLDGLTDKDLSIMKETVSRADAVGAILDPTKYREALQDRRLEYQREVIDLCITMKATINKLRTLAAGAQS